MRVERGRWRSEAQGARLGVVREPSKALTLFLASEEDRAKLDAIADAYKARFQQQAVALVIERSCLSFE